MKPDYLQLIRSAAVKRTISTALNAYLELLTTCDDAGSQGVKKSIKEVMAAIHVVDNLS